MSLYAYCLSDEVTTRMVESVAGIAGARPYLIRFGGIAAVVSDFEGEHLAVTRENVLAHERVIRRVLAETTPLPFRFGTIVNEARLESYVNSQRASLGAQLARVRGCVEMGVKVIWKLDEVKGEVTARENESAEMARGSGTEFLMAKRRERLGEESAGKRASEIADWLAESLLGVVRETKISLRPNESLMLAAAHLVERERLREYRARLQRARSRRSELYFLTSGPWPPYSFTSADA